MVQVRGPPLVEFFPLLFLQLTPTKSGGSNAGPPWVAFCLAHTWGRADNRKREMGDKSMLRFTRVVLIAIIAALAALLTTRPSAAAVTTNITVPFSQTFINPCNNDELASVAVVHVLATTNIDAAGIHTTVHFNEQDARDTDLVTGVECTDTGTLNQSGLNFIFTLPPGTPGSPSGDLPVALTVTFGGNVLCPGGAGSDKLSVLAHVTVNPDGTVTVFFNNSPGEVRCLGPG